jgi:hypothetical protein
MGEANCQGALPKVLYIMGTARSGSTILEILLSSSPDVFGAGELTELVRDGFIENKECSCGKPCHFCDIWGEVIEGLDINDKEMVRWADLQKRIDWHDGFLRQLIGVDSRRDRKRYAALNRRLLKAIARVTRAPVILDSSKYAGRALALVRLVNADVRVICLTRSPAGLMLSFQKPNKDEQLPKGIFATLLYYLVTLTSLRIATYLLRKRVRSVRYEDLLADPDGVLRDIEAWAGINLGESRRRLQNSSEFPVGHLVTGNRLRKQGSVRFKPRSKTYVLPEGLGAKTAVKLMNGWRRMLGF